MTNAVGRADGPASRTGAGRGREDCVQRQRRRSPIGLQRRARARTCLSYSISPVEQRHEDAAVGQRRWARPYAGPRRAAKASVRPRGVVPAVTLQMTASCSAPSQSRPTPAPPRSSPPTLFCHVVEGREARSTVQVRPARDEDEAASRPPPVVAALAREHVEGCGRRSRAPPPPSTSPSRPRSNVGARPCSQPAKYARRAVHGLAVCTAAPFSLKTHSPD